MKFNIDGQEFDIIVKDIRREFQVLDSENTGRVISSGRMFRDIIGTFYNYTIKISAANIAPADYDRLYEIISAPQDFHVITVPYGQTSKTYEAYITSGSDTIIAEGARQRKWGDMEIKFIAREAARA